MKIKKKEKKKRNRPLVRSFCEWWVYHKNKLNQFNTFFCLSQSLTCIFNDKCWGLLCLMVWCGWWLFVVLILVLSLNFLLIISTLPNLCCLCRTKQTTNVFQYSTIILSEGLCLYWVPIKCLYVPDRLYILTVVYLRYNGEIIKKLLLVYALFIPTLDGIQYSIYVCVIQCFCA